MVAGFPHENELVWWPLWPSVRSHIPLFYHIFFCHTDQPWFCGRGLHKRISMNFEECWGSTWKVATTDLRQEGAENIQGVTKLRWATGWVAKANMGRARCTGAGFILRALRSHSGVWMEEEGGKKIRFGFWEDLSHCFVENMRGEGGVATQEGAWVQERGEGDPRGQVS